MLNMKKLLTKLVASSELVVDIHQIYNKNLNINGGTSKEGTLNVTKPGYRPIGLAGFVPFNDGGSGSSYATAVQITAMPQSDNSCELGWVLRNPSPSNVTGISYQILVVWQKIGGGTQ